MKVNRATMRGVDPIGPWLRPIARRLRVWLLAPPDPRTLHAFARCPEDVVIQSGLRVEGAPRVVLESGVELDRDVWLHAEPGPSDGVCIRLGAGSYVGMRTILSAARRVELGERVFLGHGVLVTDHDHAYTDPGRAIADQGISEPGEVEIGAGSWVGMNAAILGSGRSLRIGRGCVIGANAVVRRDVPDHCVVVGNPGRVVKRLDPATGKWERFDAPA